MCAERCDDALLIRRNGLDVKDLFRPCFWAAPVVREFGRLSSLTSRRLTRRAHLNVGTLACCRLLERILRRSRSRAHCLLVWCEKEGRVNRASLQALTLIARQCFPGCCSDSAMQPNLFGLSCSCPKWRKNQRLSLTQPHRSIRNRNILHLDAAPSGSWPASHTVKVVSHSS